MLEKNLPYSNIGLYYALIYVPYDYEKKHST